MVGIKRLPIELLDVIFQHVASPAFRRGDQYVELPAVPSRALFPLNVASVCTLWLNILKSHPRYWQCIVIDVAGDPAPFLDTFSLFTDEKNTPLDLIVFSSSPNIDKFLENSRARTLIEHLEPSIARYVTITFRLIHQSSLPSAADILRRAANYNLTELRLHCMIHDLDDDKANVDFDDVPAPPVPVIHTALSKLSTPGSDFMNLCRAGRLATHESELDLSINHFTFRKKRAEGSVQSNFPVFLAALTILSGRSTFDITFSDLSLEYLPSTRLRLNYELQVENLTLDNVSPDFILAFFSYVTFSDHTMDTLSFCNCSIPFLGHIITGLSHSDNICLKLMDIPTQTRCALASQIQHPQDNSICNAIGAFPIINLRVVRCDGLTDDVFDWLASDDDSMPEVPLLKYVLLRDCTRFTPSSLISLLVRLYTQSQREGCVSAIAEVEVYGKGPALSQDDVSRIMNDPILREMRIIWSVERGVDVGEDFVTEFRTFPTPPTPGSSICDSPTSD